MTTGMATRTNAAPRTFRGPWWYTVGGVMFTELMLTLVWLTLLSSQSATPQYTLWIVGVGALVWVASTIPLLRQYRDYQEFDQRASGWQVTVPIAIAVVFGLAAGLLSGFWLIAILPIAQSLVLLPWPTGVRAKLVVSLMVIIAIAWYIDSRGEMPNIESEQWTPWFMFGFFSFIFPPLTVMSLWWWDTLVRLDRARIAESRLAATQERLRVATDVHDLQGHHLQVIALQLELADRLLRAGDSDAADEQLQLARASVDAARQGTRDLAMQFRSAPLTDEIANAVDLLRAAGLEASATIDPGADAAPASVLGPVIRETTTNVLRHGGGQWARLSLTREAAGWRYEIASDATRAAASSDGSGLAGIGRRVAEVGGTLRVEQPETSTPLTPSLAGTLTSSATTDPAPPSDGSFTVTVTIPTEVNE